MLLLLLTSWGPVVGDTRGTAGGADTTLESSGASDAARATAGASDGRLSGGGSDDE